MYALSLGWRKLAATSQSIIDGLGESTSPTLADLVEARRDNSPNGIAVCFRDEELTYAELDRAADQLAGVLQCRGLSDGSLVGVCLPRGPRLITALLAVLKAGAAYVVLDPELSTRVRDVLSDAAPDVVVTEAAVLDRVQTWTSPTIVIDELESHDGVVVDPSRRRPNNLAYVCYTSGSTGRPKGIAIEHRGVVAHVRGVLDAHGLSDRDVVLQVAPIGHHPSVREIFCSLAAGARLVLLDEES